MGRAGLLPPGQVTPPAGLVPSPLLQPSGEELMLAILSCAVSEQPSEDIDTNCGPFKSVMY